jgi:hypothetical protein
MHANVKIKYIHKLMPAVFLVFKTLIRFGNENIPMKTAPTIITTIITVSIVISPPQFLLLVQHDLIIRILSVYIHHSKILVVYNNAIQ